MRTSEEIMRAISRLEIKRQRDHGRYDPEHTQLEYIAAITALQWSLGRGSALLGVDDK